MIDALLIAAGPTANIEELRALAFAAGYKPVAVLESTRLDQRIYLPKGHADRLTNYPGDVIIADDVLSARARQAISGRDPRIIIDRTELILAIFARRANSPAGKLQIELAEAEHLYMILRGHWHHLERLGAGLGTRGPGESQLETDRRLVRERIGYLRARLSKLERQRETMRKSRERSNLPRIALLGYTNAGKSSLLEALSKNTIASSPALFHTLDPKIRRANLAGIDVLLSDTVGLISKLPHELVNAFHATLDEIRYADLILQLLPADLTVSEAARQRAAAQEIINDLHIKDIPLIEVKTKSDLKQSQNLSVSAKTGANLDRLSEIIIKALPIRPTVIHVPYENGALLARLYRADNNLKREDTGRGFKISARLDPSFAASLSGF